MPENQQGSEANRVTVVEGTIGARTPGDSGMMAMFVFWGVLFMFNFLTTIGMAIYASRPYSSASNTNVLVLAAVTAVFFGAFVCTGALLYRSFQPLVPYSEQRVVSGKDEPASQ